MERLSIRPTNELEQQLSSLTLTPERVVLPGVPRVGAYKGGEVCPEDFPFAASLRACLQFLGEDYGSRYVLVDKSTWKVDNLYTHIMGTSGAAFRLSWGDWWQPDNEPLYSIAEDPQESVYRAFEGTGYAYELVRKEDGRDNKVYFRARIVDSIRYEGRPVLAIGLLAPDDVSLITGYEEHDDTLIGWSYFQDSPDYNKDIRFEPSGYFRKHNWFDTTDGLVIVGEKQQEPDRHVIHRKALRLVVQMARTSSLKRYPGRRTGLEAYTAWARAMMCNDFPTNDLELLRERYRVHNDAVGTVADGRWYAAQFLKQVAEHEPGALRVAEHLHAASTCYQAEHDLMWNIWELTGGSSPSDAHLAKWAEPVVQARIADFILQAREKDAQAVANIEKALNATMLATT